eukprot:comp22627_c0_seq1/m.34774 comp22627_c0_seq1/g.34774  ORF comp22627_c0_seq1/g.34774 comp22627_c0_seq1/m.34774 type:complete len:308 (+) comp22627_c0_seq1:153-1076(+)
MHMHGPMPAPNPPSTHTGSARVHPHVARACYGHTLPMTSKGPVAPPCHYLSCTSTSMRTVIGPSTCSLRLPSMPSHRTSAPAWSTRMHLNSHCVPFCRLRSALHSPRAPVGVSRSALSTFQPPSTSMLPTTATAPSPSYIAYRATLWTAVATSHVPSPTTPTGLDGLSLAAWGWGAVGAEQGSAIFGGVGLAGGCVCVGVSAGCWGCSGGGHGEGMASAGGALGRVVAGGRSLCCSTFALSARGVSSARLAPGFCGGLVRYRSAPTTTTSPAAIPSVALDALSAMLQPASTRWPVHSLGHCVGSDHA